MIMERNMKSVRVCLLIFVLLEVMCCEGCWKEEREALLGLYSRFKFDPDYSENNIVWEGTVDCCQWERVECNSSTGRVAKLNLGNMLSYDHRHLINYSDFIVFEDLKSLDLSSNEIAGCIDNEGLENLEVLHLSYNNLDNAASILSCLDGLSSLKSLYLRWNRFNETTYAIPASVFETLSSKLLNLEVLDISGNYLTNDILPSLKGFTSLKKLYLSETGLDSDLHIQAFETLSSKLLNLEVLDISENYLTNDILPSRGGFTSLKELYLDFNKLDSDLHIQGLCSMLKNLEVLDLSGNNFNDSDIASALSGLSSLKSLNLRWCQLTSRSIFNISKLRSLEILDLAGNRLNESTPWRLENDGFSWPTGLQVLQLSGNSFSNKSLSSLSGLGCLKSLDLSGNQLGGSLDMLLKKEEGGSLDISGLSTLTSLKILDLSFNQINNIVDHQGSKSLSRLDALALDGNMINGSKLRESLRAFSSIRVLSMNDSEFIGTIIAGDFCDLSNLEHLALNYNDNLGNEFLKSIGELTSLKVLSLSNCRLNGSLPAADWSKLKKLEELDLSYNEFEGQLPSSFVNMTSLRKLELSYNHFTGNFDSNLPSLTSLEYFGFTGNHFEVPISLTPFANHSNLKFIYGGGNKVILDSQPSLQTWIPKFQLHVLSLSSATETSSLPFPNFLLYQNSLTCLDFSNWRLEGEFPHWLLENNTKMTEVVVRNCSFTGTFQLPPRPIPNIRRIDVSDNIIIGQIPSNNISSIYPCLQFLNLSKNHIQGSIPRELGQMNLLDTLDLSDNQLSGEIPKDIFGVGHQLKFLKLSNNKLEGPIFTIPRFLESLLLNNNSFTGRLPSSIFNTSIISLDISNNDLVGKIPRLIKNLSGLKEVLMPNNHFEGSIPLELVELKNLIYLDLSQNNLIGCVPSFISSHLKVIHLNNNHLSGLSKRMFNGSSSLVMLDLSYNEITNSIQDMIQDLTYTRLNILLLKGNHFAGVIPKQLCKLIELSILDLSHNNFSGAIPNCLGKMYFESKHPEQLLELFHGFIPSDPYARDINGKQLPNVQEKANFTSKKRTETYTGTILAYMSGIDLSHNKLKGSIPSELGNLTRIRALNLSYNDLTGHIPSTFSDLVQTESLDLSFNMLSGQIPPQLSRLTSLEVFSVAHNNLSGATPEWKGQFSTFDESSYEGNPFLCGPPLPKSCNPSPTIIPNDSYTHGDNVCLVDMYVFCVSFVVSYTSALLVTAAALYINPYWRRTWFYYMEFVSSNCYYFIMDNLSRFSNFRNM